MRSTSRIVWGPLYTFHKILSIVTLSSQLTKEYGETVVPVLDCREDHDEVNHTYVYNAKRGAIKESEVPYNDTSRNKCFKIYSDKEAMLNALNLSSKN